ncbi:MAG TPA: chemotaxis protein CheW [Longimicrobium sp.]|nr:chemotaxis protein CheW [Longimicrobium sp.]
MSTATAAGQAGQYLTFQLAGEEYAVELLQAREILRYEQVTRVPTAPPSIRGVLNLRGRVVPVVDLAVKLGLPDTPVTGRTCIVIVDVALEGERTVMGVIAEAVSQVVDLDAGDIEPPPPFGPRARVEFLRGMARLGERFALLLDLDLLLSAEDAAAVAAADAEHAGEGGSAADAAGPAAEAPAGAPAEVAA